jgi:hypothetical protein
MMPECEAEITSTTVDAQKGEKNGKPWEIRKQSVYVKLPWDKYPQMFSMNLPRGVQQYAVGRYKTTPQGQMNRFGDVLEIRIAQLTPVPAVKAA